MKSNTVPSQAAAILKLNKAPASLTDRRRHFCVNATTNVNSFLKCKIDFK